MRILYITTIGSTMGFFTALIKSLVEKGNIVDIACNVSESQVPQFYYDIGCKVYALSCVRSPFDKGNISAVKEIRSIVKDGNYDIVHCHTPIAAMCTRIACRELRKGGLKVFYTAHGFHFYKGAPVKNWLFYYPVEWLLAHWTDVLITINREDYVLAKKHMAAGHVEYVPGVGIDVKNFAPELSAAVDKWPLLDSLGASDNDKILLSVGELSVRKNHEVVIKALAKLKNSNIHYAIAGTGDLKNHLVKVVKDLGLDNRVHFLGHRNDVAQLLQITDLYIFPSFQEGLPVALMEAMASKTPVICSNIRGNNELIKEKALFNPSSVDDVAHKIGEYLTIDKSDEVEENYRNIRKYDLSNIISTMELVYGGKNDLFSTI